MSTNSNTEGNSLTVRLLITKDSTTGVDKTEGYLSAYVAKTGVTTTETYSPSIKWNYYEGYRTATVTLANGTKTSTFEVYDGESSPTLDVELLGSATLTIAETDGELVAAHSVLTTEKKAEVTTEISFDNSHLTHNMTVMKLFGVPYITKGIGTYDITTTGDGTFKVHYTECLDCGLAYLATEHTATNEAHNK